MGELKKITVAYGDGIGPEITEAVMSMLQNAGAKLDYDFVEIGMKAFKKTGCSGISDGGWEVIRKNKILLKGPTFTQQGKGFSSINVELRKRLGLFANVRPTKTHAPFVKTNHPEMDVWVVRENEEDVYGGIENQQTPEVAQGIKMMTAHGCERIVRFAFDLAKREERTKVTCMTKDNILKLTDGMFHEIFKQVALDYPSLISEHMIIDAGLANFAAHPEAFDVIVVPNLYGDILSDVASELAGSLGLAGSGNFGQDYAVFEAVHGSAPSIAGENIANPSGLFHAALLMLSHLGEKETAQSLHNAWLKTIEDGYHTQDIYNPSSRQLCSTVEFSQAVIQRLGEKPKKLNPVYYHEAKPFTESGKTLQNTDAFTVKGNRDFVGTDVFIYYPSKDLDALTKHLESFLWNEIPLISITNRGVIVYPSLFCDTFLSDQFRLRFLPKSGKLTQARLLELLTLLTSNGLEILKVDNLYTFDGVPKYRQDTLELKLHESKQV